MAQFVQPVGDALQGKACLVGALLAVVGYVLYAEAQRFNGASTAQRENEETLGLMVQRLERQRLGTKSGWRRWGSPARRSPSR
ncbi:hypothetical protein [Streptomyces griseochromogenes]|uniref:hypothetical protein n=1 Tax=Streptomyces griseochromogenes TaxID=68214 RepID=UPI0037A05FE4